MLNFDSIGGAKNMKGLVISWAFLISERDSSHKLKRTGTDPIKPFSANRMIKLHAGSV